MEITDKWLGEIGGWQALKAARALLAAGRVEVVENSPGLVRGFAGAGKSRVASGLRIRARTDVDNLCTCPTARRHGQICEHALAVALASVSPAGASPPSAATPAPSGRAVPAPVRQTGSRPQTAPIPGAFSLFLPESLLDSGAAAGRAATAFLKFDPGGVSVEQPARLLPALPETDSASQRLAPRLAPDEALAAWLAARQVPAQSMPLHLPPAEIPGLLAALVEHPRVFTGKPAPGQHRPLAVTDLDIRPLLKITPFFQGGSNNLDEVILRLSEQPPPRLIGSSWLLHPTDNSLHPWAAPSESEARKISEALLAGAPPEQTRRPLRWLAAWLGTLETVFQIELDEVIQSRFRVVPVPADYEIEVSGSLQTVQLSVRGRFQGHDWSVPGLGSAMAVPARHGARVPPPAAPYFDEKATLFPIEDESKNGVFYVSNIILESAICDRLQALGFVLQGGSGRFELRGPREVMRFYASHLPVLEREFTVRVTDAWRQATRGLLRITPELRPAGDDRAASAPGASDWLAMSFNYRAPDGFHLSRTEALRLIRSGQSTMQGRDGKRYVIDAARCEELEEALQDVPVELTPEGGRLTAMHAEYFLPFAERATLASTRDETSDLPALRQELGSLGDVLRPYQLEGVAWLAQRLEAGQGALLGDDMGLGKTLQSIAAVQRYLALARTDAGAGRPQALVVCPKSLIPNWQAEFERFAPALKVLAIHGNRREELLQQADNSDVLISSYQLIVKDLAHFKKREFAIGVLDEASFIRNPDTEAAKALRSLRLRARIALSGTPVENGARDLWSIFHILLPGYLGDRKHFQERFEKPLQTAGAGSDAAADSASRRLKRLIRPFFLRRTKGEVLKELPEKIEQVLWCEPSAIQAEVYRRLLEEGREEIRAAQRRSGRQGSRMTMFTVLLRLRQVCCDLRLAGLPASLTDGLTLDELSGKWPVFEETLSEALAGGSKILIFSQFVAYLQRCRDILETQNIGYSYLDGSTRDRKTAVESFQNEPQRRVFLISLKAGGYGLNLTQADRVILMDPWWNPAVEAQAIDRAHRFGQNRAVNASRLIVRGTVEERILELQQKKRGLIAATIEERAPMMQGLTDADLEGLLEG